MLLGVTAAGPVLLPPRPPVAGVDGPAAMARGAAPEAPVAIVASSTLSKK